MPSTGMPSDIFSSIDRRPGNDSVRPAARSRTASVSSSSRLAMRETSAISPGRER